MGSTNIYTYSDHPNHNHAFHWGLYENSGSGILKRVGMMCRRVGLK